jgi:superfamily II DNA/RNA helicase
VATDIAARGLAVKGIDLVINVDMARNADDYTHRIGRTGRAGESGTAISLIVSYEWDLMARVKRHLGADVEQRVIKELEGNFKGPRKIKTSGKAASSKKRIEEKDSKTKKSKIRARDTKNVGKRRQPANPGATFGDGFAPASVKRNKLKPDEDE